MPSLISHGISMATMASSSVSLLSLLILILFLASSAAARPGLPFHPCKTLLISTYSVSLQPRKPHGDHHHHHPNRPEFFAVVTEVREFHPKPLPVFGENPGFFPENPQFRPHHPHGFIRSGEDQTLIRRPSLSLGSTSSFRDRSLDVLNVLSSLLFGAACGALTAATMYLIWSLFNGRFEAYRNLDDFSDDDDNEDDDDIFNPKKPANNKDEAYVAVPAPPSADSTETALLKKESA